MIKNPVFISVDVLIILIIVFDLFGMLVWLLELFCIERMESLLINCSHELIKVV